MTDCLSVAQLVTAFRKSYWYRATEGAFIRGIIKNKLFFMKRIILGVTVLFFSIIAVKAQVAITNDGSNADANTMLDIKSNNKGVKFPRLTTIQRKAIPVTVADAGLMVFDTDRQVLYMYDGNEWLPFAVSVAPVGLIKKKMPPGLQSGSFGAACAVSGDYAVVGAYSDSVGTNYYQGSVYVFKKMNGNWMLQTRLVASDGAAGDNFGVCVSIDGGYIAIGSTDAYNAASVRTGAVYIYKLNGAAWDQHQKLTVADAGLKYFGISLHLQGNMLIAGSSAATVGINVEQGAAYVFAISGNLWALQKRLLANDGQANNRFGTSVAINNNDIIVGSNGAAYVFIKNGNLYSFQQKLLSNSQSNITLFGCSVSISNDVAIIGA